MNRFELYSVRIDGLGGPSERLMDVQNLYDIYEYKMSPDGTNVVFRLGRTTLGEHELWSVPTTGPLEQAVKISRSLTSGGAVDTYFQISPDGARVVYRADATLFESYNLYSVPIRGTTSTQLNGPLGTNEDVATGFSISADSIRVVYRSDEGTDTVDELYSVKIADGTLRTKLNGVLFPGGDVLGSPTFPDFRISPNSEPNSQRVVYLADQDVDTVNELYSVPITGGTPIPIKLNGMLVSNKDVLSFAISPNSQRVVYLADQTQDTLNELFSVPIGGGTASRLNRTLTSGGDVQTFRISPDSNWVCLLYTSPSPRDGLLSRMPSSA